MPALRRREFTPATALLWGQINHFCRYLRALRRTNLPFLPLKREAKAHGGGAMIDNRTQVFDVAMKNARTIEACLDRLAMMGAEHQLKLIAGRLSLQTQGVERRSRHDQRTNAAALAE